MFATTLDFPRTTIGKVSLIYVCCVLFAATSSGQVKRAQPDQGAYGFTVADAIAKVQSGKFAGVHVDLIAEAGAVEAIPALEKQFESSPDPLDKGKIAQGLVKLGDQNDMYWNFLVKLATPAVNSNAPDFVNRDAQGNEVPGLSPAFIAWAKASNTSPDAAGEDAVYIYPGEVMLLGATGDKRAIPLLRQALSSPNYLIEAAAAKGLAETQDAASIPLIIAACKKAPSDAANLIARSLVYFDDPQAQAAVNHFIPSQLADGLRQARTQGRTPSH